MAELMRETEESPHHPPRVVCPITFPGSHPATSELGPTDDQIS